MSYKETKTSESTVASADWNEMASQVVQTSGMAFGHSSNTDLHYPSSLLVEWLNTIYQGSGSGADVAWSGASGYVSVSGNVATLYTWYSNSSNKLSNSYASASIAIYEETYSSEGDLTSVLDDNYHPSGYVISGQEYSKAYASAQIAIYDATDIFDETLYITSSNSIDRFADSSNYSTHRGSSNIHINWTNTNEHLKTTGTISGNALATNQYLHHIGNPATRVQFTDSVARLEASEDCYFILDDSGAEPRVTWHIEDGELTITNYDEGNLVKVDGSASVDSVGIGTNPSYKLHVNGDFYANLISGGSIQTSIVEQSLGNSSISTNAVLSNWTSSNMYTTTEVDTISSSIVTHLSNNYYDTDWIDTFSGNIDTRIDGIGGMDPTDYITSTNSITRFSDSSQVNWTNITAISSGFDGRLDTLEGLVDQDVTNGSAPTFTADNFSDGGTNAIITTTQESNYEATHNWFDESSQKLSTISGSLSSRIDDLGGFDSTSYIVSTNAIARFGDSSNLKIKLTNISTQTVRADDSLEPSPINFYGLGDVYANLLLEQSAEGEKTWLTVTEFGGAGYSTIGPFSSNSQYGTCNFVIKDNGFASLGYGVSSPDYMLQVSGTVASEAVSSQKISGGTIGASSIYGTTYTGDTVRVTNFTGIPAISSQVSGAELRTKLYSSKPNAGNHAGEIIRTSGNSNGTWVWISVYDGSSYEWMQLGVATS